MLRQSGVGILTGDGFSGFGQLAGNIQICEPPSTALPRSFTLTSTAHDQGCRLTRVGQPKMAMRQSVWLDHRRNYRCVVVMPRIDEEISFDDEFQVSFLNYG